MTDKELLELAAKAHGELVQAEPNGDWIYEDADGNRGAWWNPITDDGDALRLAVKLMMEISIYRNCVYVTSSVGDLAEEKIITDPYDATRRAIVRVAAEIGRTM